MPAMSFKPDLPVETVKRLKGFKGRTGVSYTHMIEKAIETYLDIQEGKAKLVRPEPAAIPQD